MTPNVLFRALFILVFSTVATRAEVRLHNLFSDHMVLQQNTSVPVWGWADDGEKITVEFGGQKVSTTAKKDRWMVKLKNLKPGPAATLKIFSTHRSHGNEREQNTTIQIDDVLVGEVWLASGQSNMEWPLSKSFEPAKEIEHSANPNIRLFTVPRTKLNAPTNNVKSSWQECGPKTVPGFSAVAYYFARDLQKALGVPVGIIHTSWGGSPAEVWMREEVLAKDDEYKRDLLDAYPAAREKWLKALDQWKKEKAEAEKAGKAFTNAQPYAVWKPAELYNAMIAPLIPYAVQGAIWYQGESNAGRAWQYRRLFADMIKNWRNDWDRDFTFLEVQLAPWDKRKGRSVEEITASPTDSDWAELREAQWLTARKLKKAGMAVITDLGDKDDIHPTKKQPVGARLALLARKIAYGEKTVADGPTYDGVKFKNGKAILSFENVDGGLESHGSALTGFAVAGNDQKFHWATAIIDGDKVVVSSAAAPNPVAVRYGWADFPVVNLFNKQGLPATPFRTDDWEPITKPKAKEAGKK
jgi:sialate O-acetylesterase